MAKLPAFQFYPGDWRKDIGIQSLSFHDRGVWWEMLCLMHESEQRGVLMLNGAALSEESLSRLLGLDKQILTTTLTNLLTLGVASTQPESGAIMCRRMVRDENLRQVRTEAGKKGGNPALLNQNSTTGDKQIPTPSSSSSSSSSIQKPSRAKSALLNQNSTTIEIPDWLPIESWNAFVQMRTKIKKPLTEHAKGLQIKKLESLRDAGYDPTMILDNAVMNNWQGLYVPKGPDGKPVPAAPKKRTVVEVSPEEWWGKDGK